MLDSAPPPATRDCPPFDSAVNRWLDETFARIASVYGFEEVSTPIFERADVFTARSGPEIKNSLLTFHCDHEEYALRPELTAPVCRLVASGALGDRPSPYKLFYVGPCFRYCRPHTGRQRQFTQAGLELLGDGSPKADAEVIAAASRFLQSVGIREPALTIGTAGIFRSLLPEELSAEERATVIGHLDRLASIRDRCREIATRENPLVVEQLRMDRRDLASLQAQDGYEGEFAITNLPAPDGQELAKRLPEEAAATFRRIWNVQGYVPEETAELLIRTSAIRGTLDDVSRQAAEVLDGSGADRSLANLMEVCRLLGLYGIERFEVSLAIGRGLTFYTGTVFEMASAHGKLCGGGRYDSLVELFGGDSTPATGCALRFDTIVQARGARRAGAASHGIEFVPGSPADEADAVSLAEELRSRNIAVGTVGAAKATIRAGRMQLPDDSDVAIDPITVMENIGHFGTTPEPTAGESQ